MNYSKLSGFVAVIFGVAYLGLTLQLKEATLGNPMGHKLFPIGLASLMIILGIMQIIKTRKEKFIINTDKDPRQTFFVIKIVVISVLYVMLLKPLGYVVATIIFLQLIFFVFNGFNKIVRNVIVTLVFTIGIYYVFNNLLGVHLPEFNLF